MHGCMDQQFWSIFGTEYLCNDLSNKCGSKVFFNQFYEFFSWVTSIFWMQANNFLEFSSAVDYRCLKKIARIRRTQNRCSGYICLMCRVLVHIYLSTFFDNRGFTHLRLLFVQRSYPEISFKLRETIICDLLKPEFKDWKISQL